MIRRTAIVTALSIASVVVAGGAAVGANIGILNAANDDPIGGLSASADSVVPVGLDAIAPIDATSGSDGTGAYATLVYAVDQAGTAEVGSDGTTLTLGAVTPAVGWTAQVTVQQPARLVVAFGDGTRHLEFIAELDANGRVVARVDEPVTVTETAAPAPAPPATSAPTVRADDDDYEEEDGDDHEDADDRDQDDHDEDRDHEDGEHEGRDDDD
ncbi:MAG: hypothetical protein ACK5PP_04590 [Acidimicrobiales bacterium]